MRYINTALAIGMLTDGDVSIETISLNYAKKWVNANLHTLTNACNPHHANTLDGLSRQLGIDIQSGATGARFTMNSGDQCLVFALVPPPGYGRETREFTDEELNECKISFRLVTMK